MKVRIFVARRFRSLHRLAVLFRVVTALLLAVPSVAWADDDEGPFSGIVAFGDSLTDRGRFFAATLEATGIGFPPPPYDDGRLSNGPLWIEELATQLGLPKPTAYSLTSQEGNDFAFAGAESGFGRRLSPPEVLISDLGEQIVEYLASNALDDDELDDELFVIWIGANDFFGGQTDAMVPVQNLSSHISTLSSFGAENFLVLNLPPLGQTPFARKNSPLDPTSLDSLSAEFNKLLNAELDDLEDNLGIRILRVDVFELFEEVTGDPPSFGLANVTEPALLDLESQTVVPNPDEYLFWDDLHPTTVAHTILGGVAAAVILEELALEEDEDD